MDDHSIWDENRKWPRHVKGDSCPGCDARMTEAHPRLNDMWVELKQTFKDIHVSWVWRNEVQQNQFVINGSSKAVWPRSKHNSMIDGKPCARAIDVFLLNAKGSPIWDPGVCHDLWRWMQAQKFPVRWGGAWKSIGDYNHFELEEFVEPRGAL